MNNELVAFEDHEIRRHYDEVTETWWFSVVDIIQVLTQQPNYKLGAKLLESLKTPIKYGGKSVGYKL